MGCASYGLRLVLGRPFPGADLQAQFALGDGVIAAFAGDGLASASADGQKAAPGISVAP